MMSPGSSFSLSTSQLYFPGAGSMCRSFIKNDIGSSAFHSSSLDQSVARKTGCANCLSLGHILHHCIQGDGVSFLALPGQRSHPVLFPVWSLLSSSPSFSDL